MALNPGTFIRNCLIPLHYKGLTYGEFVVEQGRIYQESEV